MDEIKLKPCPFCGCEAIPAADVEPVRRGRWIVPPPPDAYTYRKVVCSECHKVAGKHKTVYCPNCGAKMDLEDENHENFSSQA